MTLPLASLSEFHWLRPQWLWALMLLPVLVVAWRARQRRRSAWRDAVDPHLLTHLLDAPQSHATSWPWLSLLAATMTIVALAAPSWQRAPQRQWQDKSPLVIALDLSSAELANDLPPSRLLQARAKITQLLQARASGQVGLVVFADDAYTVAPLTDDVQNLAVFTDALSPDIMPADGSRADRAIAWATKLLRQAGFRRGDILLLTDHADDAARSAAASAAHDGYRVSVVGLGTQAGATYRDGEGQFRRTSLDADSLQRAAASGDGAYIALTADTRDLRALGVLDPSQSAAVATQGPQSLAWIDDGYWLLPPLMLLGLLAFRRGRPLAVVLLCIALPWQPAHASVRDWWLRPDQQAHARIEQGAQAYRKGNYAAAQNAWRGIRDADALYDLGNALAKQGNYDQAIAAYDQALKFRPGMDDALANKRAVEAARRRKSMSNGPAQSNQKQNGGKQPRAQPDGQQQGGQSNDAQQKGQQRDQQQNAQQQPGRQSAQQQQGAQSPRPPPDTQQRGSASSPPQPPKPASAEDAARQRAANAAQRQRMQQALQQARLRQDGRGARPVQRAETQAERERRLSDQAWLQRVPDDPGGLLRAKFQLEYERRQQAGGG